MEQEFNTKTDLFCPKCGKQTIVWEGGGFTERGVYDDENYEAEGDVITYECTSCQCIFALEVPDLQAQRAEDGLDALGDFGFDNAGVSDDVAADIAGDYADERDKPIKCAHPNDEEDWVLIEKLATAHGIQRMPE